MKRAFLFIAVFSLAGAVLAWSSAFLREPVFLSEAVVEVRGGVRSPEEQENIRRRLADPPVLLDIARRAGGPLAAMDADTIARRSRVEILDGGGMRLSFVAADPRSAEAFVAAWTARFEWRPEGKGGRPDRDAAAATARALERSREALRTLLTGDASLSPVYADLIMARLSKGDRLEAIVVDERARVAGELFEAEQALRRLEAKERSLEAALRDEEQYIVTYELKEENPVVRDVQQQLTEKQVRLQRLMVDATSRHPLRARLEGEIQQMEEYLKGKPLESVREQKREISPVYRDIAIELSRTRREAGTLRNHIASSRQAVDAAARKLGALAAGEGGPGNPLGDFRAALGAAAESRARAERAAAAPPPLVGSYGVRVVEKASPGVRRSPVLRIRMLVLIGAAAGAGAGVLAWSAVLFLRHRPPSLAA
ncbi:MAG: hypothetical protein PHN82_08500 [bacterium]|nr:hypothetical protein [bacterium]